MVDEIHPPKKIYIKFINPKKGWGVFCKEKISKGEIIEQCYGVIDNYETSALQDYVFMLNEKIPESLDVIHALGYGAVYNHSDDSNASWSISGNVLEFVAVRDIEIDEEICTYYGVHYVEKYKSRFI